MFLSFINRVSVAQNIFLKCLSQHYADSQSLTAEIVAGTKLCLLMALVLMQLLEAMISTIQIKTLPNFSEITRAV